MSASQDDCVNLIILSKQLVDVFLHEIVGTWCLGFVVFNEGNPHWTRLSCYLDFREKFMYFHDIRFRFDCAGSGQNTDMFALGDTIDTFYGRADNAQYTSVRIDLREIVDLYAT